MHVLSLNNVKSFTRLLGDMKLQEVYFRRRLLERFIILEKSRGSTIRIENDVKEVIIDWALYPRHCLYLIRTCPYELPLISIRHSFKLVIGTF